MASDPSLLIAQRRARSYARRLIRVKQLAVRSLLHDDKTLTWIAGLMGGGLLAIPTVVAAACAPNPQRRLYIVAAPWAIGVLCAVAGRLVSAKHRDADDVFYTVKLAAQDRLLLSAEPDTEFRRRYEAIRSDDDPAIKVRRETVCGSDPGHPRSSTSRCLCVPSAWAQSTC